MAIHARAAGGIPQRFDDIIGLQVTERAEDLVDSHPVGSHVDDCRHRDPRTANAASPPILMGGMVVRVNVAPELPVTQLTPTDGWTRRWLGEILLVVRVTD